VRAYLAEFLSDPRVVELPRWLWLPVLHGIVLRRRPAQSAAKYAKIWTPEGSPLAVHTRRQAELLRQATGLPVEYAMRYGEPGIAAALRKLPAPARQRVARWSRSRRCRRAVDRFFRVAQSGVCSRGCGAAIQ